MATTVGTEQTVSSLLESLIELDYDAIEAYKAAIARVDAIADRSILAQFLQDHERHVSDLGSVLRAMGGKPPEHGDAKQLLTQGKVIIGGLVGDRVVLLAMKTNEDDTNTAYERALAHPDLTTDVRALLERNLEDERRHRTWIEDRIAQTAGVSLKQAS